VEGAEKLNSPLKSLLKALPPTTRYENIVQIRCLYEGVAVDDMLASWNSKILPQYMEKWQLDRQEVRGERGCACNPRTPNHLFAGDQFTNSEPHPPNSDRRPAPRPQLVTLFGRVRDEWIADDLAGWLAPNRIYPGVAEAVRGALAGGDEVYVVTTKQVGTRGRGLPPFPSLCVASGAHPHQLLNSLPALKKQPTQRRVSPPPCCATWRASTCRLTGSTPPPCRGSRRARCWRGCGRRTPTRRPAFLSRTSLAPWKRWGGGPIDA
jgi:hypothetical protein